MSDHPPEDPADPDLAAAEGAVRWARTCGSTARIVSHARARRRRRRRTRLALGALCTVLIGAVMVLRLRHHETPAAPVPRTLVVGAPARQALPDGSVVDLREGATIAVQFDSAARRVILDKGQAYFSVVKDPSRPFTVSAAGIEIRTLGTAFSVQLEPDGVEVLVTEGRVAVDKPADAALPAAANSTTGAVRKETILTLDAGKRALVPRADAISSRRLAAPAVVSLSEAEINALLAWRVPRIELTGTPLADVIEVFNRYSDVRLRLADPALGSIGLSGVLRPDNPNALLHVLNVEFGLEVDRRPNGEIVLHRR